ncbi:response regulator [Brevundimonas vesicularis]|uniref:response regulator n=1 Tax=Brevundimonas vesicularis TaxID=41276 RepID=UPI0038D46A79
MTDTINHTVMGGDDIARLCTRFDGLLARGEPLGREATAELRALANIFDLDSRAEPSELWPRLRTVLKRQMPSENPASASPNEDARTVLLVEDDAETAAELTETLDAAGHRVVGPFHSAEAAEAATALHQIDLALLDINLSGPRTGIDLARDLKSRWGTPVIFISGDVTEAARNADLAAAMVIKPYSSRDILAAIARLDVSV